MSLNHPQSNRLLLVLGIFLAFLVISAPHTARADVCDEQGDFNTSYASTHSNMAGRLTTIHKDYLNNAPTLDTTHYCMDVLLKYIQTIRLLMVTADVDFMFMEILGVAMDSLVQSVCQALGNFLTNIQQALTNSLVLKLCLPFPQLHLGLKLPTLGNTCIGIGNNVLGAVGLQIMANPPNASPNPNQWKIWGGANSKFQVYVPKGVQPNN